MGSWGRARFGAVAGGLALMSAVMAAQRPRLERVTAPGNLQPLPFVTTGRVWQGPPAVEDDDSSFGSRHVFSEWPGVMFDTAFRGGRVFFRVGNNHHLRITVDHRAPLELVKPEYGVYRLSGLGQGPHHVRVQVVSEDQSVPMIFSGFALPPGEKALSYKAPARQIEFVGDSHTVGYGNTSAKTVCSNDEVWATTDTAKAFGALVAGHYSAAYEVNAISGRGVVRNYGGNPESTLVDEYPYASFDKRHPVEDPQWKPQVVVIALGTNDFSTPLHAGERWSTRDELHADYERSYVAFLQQLRERDPGALLVVWTTGDGGGEIETEAARAVDAAKAAGVTRLVLVPVNGLAFSGCNSHPSLRDDAAIAAKLEAAVDKVEGVWGR